MVRRTWMTIPTLAVGVLLALPAGAQDTRDTRAELADLLLADGMTHEEVAVELLRALDGAELAQPDCVPGEEMFDDVPASNPFCPFIEELARRGITTGCDDDNFCPGATVSRAQMATFIVRAMEATQTSSAIAASGQQVLPLGVTTLTTVPIDVPSGGGAGTATATLQILVPAGTSVSCFIVIADSQGLTWGAPEPTGSSATRLTHMTFVHRSTVEGPTVAFLQCTREGESPGPISDPIVSQSSLSVVATPR